MKTRSKSYTSVSALMFAICTGAEASMPGNTLHTTHLSNRTLSARFAGFLAFALLLPGHGAFATEIRCDNPKAIDTYLALKERQAEAAARSPGAALPALTEDAISALIKELYTSAIEKWLREHPGKPMLESPKITYDYQHLIEVMRSAYRWTYRVNNVRLSPNKQNNLLVCDVELVGTVQMGSVLLEGEHPMEIKGNDTFTLSIINERILHIETGGLEGFISLEAQ